MSELLLHWLNNDLQLSTYVTDVERDFASGYLLGEILHRLNHQHNFSDFMNREIADAKIINFCLLEPTLRHLNIKFDSKIATAIMNSKSGAAANLLYQIKMAAERLARAPGVSTRSLERHNIRPLHNMPPKLAKPEYDQANHYLFEHAVRRQVKSLGGLKREREAMDEELRQKEAYRADQERLREELEVTKAERLHRAFIHSQYIKTALDETDSPAWRLAIAKKNERERRRAKFYRQLAADRSQRQDELTYSLKHSVEHDLDEFERQTTSKSTVANGARKSIGYGLRSLSTTLERTLPETTTATTTTTTAILRDQRQHRERRREQLERRRRRFVQDTLERHTTMTHVRLVELLESMVARETGRERQAQQDRAKIRIYTEIARTNRHLREEQYTQRREYDAEEAVHRDTSAMELLFAKYNDDVLIHETQRMALDTARKAAHHHENHLVVEWVVHELVEFAMHVAGHREASLSLRDSDVNPAPFVVHDTTWHELRFQFAHGLDHDHDHVDAGQEHGVILSKQQMRDYLAHFWTPTLSLPTKTTTDVVLTGRSPWVPTHWKCLVAIEVLADRVALGEVVKYVRWLTRMAECAPPAPAPTIPRQALTPVTSTSSLTPSSSQDHVVGHDEIVPTPTPTLSVADNDSSTAPKTKQGLRILLFGPPFAGKHTQACLLATMYDLEVLSVQQLLETAMTDPLHAVGQDARRRLAAGEPLPASIYSQLLVDALPRSGRGWIVYDLPSTREQAQSLEEHLSGYEDPTQIASPFDDESILAPGSPKPPLPLSFLHGKSGVDLAFYLHATESSVLERCLAHVEDRATHADWHLVHNAPPVDSTERHRLEHVNHTTNASSLLSVQCLTLAEDMAPGLRTWLTMFNTLCDVSMASGGAAAPTPERIHERLVEYVDAFYARQASERDAAERAKEDTERRWMLEEESRQSRLADLQHAITMAQETVVKAQQTVQQAEEAKAKKEEIAELRANVDAARLELDHARVTARDWILDERLQVVNTRTIYSGRLYVPLGRALASIWNCMEVAYETDMVAFFTDQRRVRSRVTQRAAAITESFCTYVRRPDTKQTVVNAFQTEFNAVLDDMRFETTTKQELHARTDLLQDALTLILETKQRENHDELVAIMSDGWLEDTTQWSAVVHQRALQAECDRFRVSIQLLVDACHAASDDPAQLAGMRDVLQANPLDLTVRAFVDTQAVAAAAAAAAAAVAVAEPQGKGKAPPSKGGGKPPLVPAAATPATSDQVPAGSGDPLGLEDLALMYDHVVQRAEAVVQLVVQAPPKVEAVPVAAAPVAAAPAKPGKTGTTPAASPASTPASSAVSLPRHSIDISTANCIKAIKYELDLFQRRVRFLREHALTTNDDLARAMRSVEATLQRVIETRMHREAAAIAAVIQAIRTAVEAETDLPLYINVQPTQVYRFPTTLSLREDTLVCVDPAQRLVPRAPVEPPPVVEPQHAFLLNPRQRETLRGYMAQLVEYDAASLAVPLCVWIETMVGLVSVPHALPSGWKTSTSETWAKVGTAFANTQTSLVDVEAVLTVLSEDEVFVQTCIG